MDSIRKLFANKGVLWSVIVVGVISVFSLTMLLINQILSNAGGDDSQSYNSLEVDFDESDVIPGEPYLLMKITDSPSLIGDMCQEVSFTFEAENVGDTTLKYSDLENNYYFGLTSEDAVSSFDGSFLIGTFDTSHSETDDAGLMPYTKIVSDFGEIAPGEQKTVVYRSINYVIYGQHDYYWTNSFNNIINGNFNYSIEFGKLSEKGYFYSKDISKSSAVRISTSLYESEDMWTDCEYELITDMSVDFYE